MNKIYQPKKHVAIMIGIDGNPEFLSPKNPKIWGSYYWQAFFMYASKYPLSNPTPQEQKEVKNTFIKIGNELPCSLCRISYNELLERYPIDQYLSSRKSLISWLYLIRDAVNRKLIIQEREEVKRYLKHLPPNIKEKQRKEVEKRILYTKPSPSIQVILKRWMNIKLI